MFCVPDAIMAAVVLVRGGSLKAAGLGDGPDQFAAHATPAPKKQ